MGTWSTEILDDDFACDVYDVFMAGYDNGKELELIRTEAEKANSKAIADLDKGPIFWLALAQAQWECGALDSDVRQKVREIVQQGLGLEPWAEGAAQLLQERKEVLRSFLVKIETPPVKVRRREPRKEHPPIFAPGVCLSVLLPNGEFGAVIVLAAKHEHKEFGKNLVGILAYHSKSKPTLATFEAREWLRTKRQGVFRQKELIWLLAQGFAGSAKLFEIVGTTKLRWFDPRDSKISAPQWSIVPVKIQKAIKGII